MSDKRVWSVWLGEGNAGHVVAEFGTREEADKYVSENPGTYLANPAGSVPYHPGY